MSGSWVGGNGSWFTASNWSNDAVPTSSDFLSLDGTSAYTVSIASGNAAADFLELEDAQATLMESGPASLSLQTFEMQFGLAILDGSNTIGASTINGGKVQLGSSGALGSGAIDFGGGELEAMMSLTLGNHFSLQANASMYVSSDTGNILSLGSGGFSVDGNLTSLNLNSSGETGTIVVYDNANSTYSSTFLVSIGGGVLQAGSENSASFFNYAALGVQAGAKFDLNGLSERLYALDGSGQVISSAGPVTLTVTDGLFSGKISGAISLVIGAVEEGQEFELSSAQTYTGTTSIQSGGRLDLMDGGSVAGGIVDSGTLGLVTDGAMALTSSVSGSGMVLIDGAGSHFIGHADSYTGGTLLAAGTLAVANSQAFGTGAITFSANQYGEAELLGVITEEISNKLIFSDYPPDSLSVIAAAHGHTLTVGGGGWTIEGGNVQFGDRGQDGIVSLRTPQGSTAASFAYHVSVADGTLKALGASLTTLLAKAETTTVASGAVLDLAGYDTTINGLDGSGSVTDSAAADKLFLTGNGDFAGVISGAQSLYVESGITTLTGANTYSGSTKVALRGNLVLGEGGSAGSILSSTIEDDGLLTFDHGGKVATGPVITGSGRVMLEGASSYSIGQINSYSGGTIVHDGKLAFNLAGALGSGWIAIGAAGYVARVDVSISPSIALHSLAGDATLAVSSGQTLTLAPGSGWTLDATGGASFVLGSKSETGTIQWDTALVGITNAADGYRYELAGGTVRLGAGGQLLPTPAEAQLPVNSDLSFVVEKHATFDLAGQDQDITNLLGSGTLTASGSDASQLMVIGGDFAGRITGNVHLLVEQELILTGSSIFYEGTEVAESSSLQIGDGGTKGSIGGPITLMGDDSSLIIDLSKNIELSMNITGGAGLLLQEGSGVTTLSGENDVGEVEVVAGTLAIVQGAALGNQPVVLKGGELLGVETLTVGNSVFIEGDAVIAATDGTTMTISGSTSHLAADALTFGTAAADGIVRWMTPIGQVQDHSAITVGAGTLQAGDNSLAALLGFAQLVSVEAGATLDLAGFSASISDLEGLGTVTGAAGATLRLNYGDFAGTISGGLAVDITGYEELDGSGTFTGNLSLEAAATLSVDGAASEGIRFVGQGASLVIGAAASLTGVVSYFKPGDVIDFTSVAASSASEHYSGRQLTVTDGTHTFRIELFSSANYDFHLRDDGSGGTAVYIEDESQKSHSSHGHSAVGSSSESNQTEFSRWFASDKLDQSTDVLQVHQYGEHLFHHASDFHLA